jgi:hypothetical protein
MPKYLLLIATIVVGGLSSTAQSAVISATNNQLGDSTSDAIYTATGKLVRVANFTGLSPLGPLTDMQFRGFSKNALDPPFVKPKLYLSAPGFTPGTFLFALAISSPNIVETNVQVQNTSAVLIQPVSSGGFVPLTSMQASGIQSILASSGGAIDAWMLSGNNQEFYFPAFQQSFIPGFPPTPVVETFQSTLDFLVVPEPTSIATYGILIGIWGLARRRRGMKK